jgi:hypothetical protein
MRSDRRRSKHAHIFAYAMWIVFGTGLVILGIMMGFAYVRETAEDRSGTGDEVAGKPAPDETPRDVDPEGERRRRDANQLERMAAASNTTPEPKPKPKPEPSLEQAKKPAENPDIARAPETAQKPKPKPVGPQTLEDAGGSKAGQQIMLSRSRAVVDRSDEMARKGELTSEDMRHVAELTQRGRATLAKRNEAFDAERWGDVMRYTREKNLETTEHEDYLDGVEHRHREVLRKAAEKKKREAAELEAATWTLDKIRILGKFVHKLPQDVSKKVALYKLQSAAERVATKKTKGFDYYVMKTAAEKLLAAYNRLAPKTDQKTVQSLTR